ncbi:mCG140613, partial [Mus musculus]
LLSRRLDLERAGEVWRSCQDPWSRTPPPLRQPLRHP